MVFLWGVQVSYEEIKKTYNPCSQGAYFSKSQMIEETMKMSKITQRDRTQWALQFVRIMIHNRILEKELELKKKKFQDLPRHLRVLFF